MATRSARAAAVVLGLGLVVAVAPTAVAGGAEHATMTEEFDGSEHFAAGEQPCVPWAGTFHEVRDGAYALLVAPGGQVAGEVHVNGAVDGYVELVPDDPGDPTYTGTYREKLDGVFIGTDAQGEDVLRTAQFRLTVGLQGSDGSRRRLRLSGKVTLDAQGRLVVDRSTWACD